ncbi:lantibiotic dehydratase [Hymenobacter pini]|uniref:lantibiotic dehydratase n=1 Tax=Hymenobacter pini TaxID=2880879 RepID=UPI001CF22D6F|nr:lantibiotic dehydratase [Hymenobacter pini]MCA8832858.1 lantibiotic dehydratase [Hymenobacter pini]
MAHAYQFHPHVVLRTPAAPFTLAVDAATIQAALHDEQFREAIYLASPSLLEECEKWRLGELTEPRKLERLQSTLTRYFMRRSSRCTPFGLFASCTLVKWGAHSHIQLNTARNGRHTRLDMHYLCALAQHLAAHPTVRPHLRYWPSTSLYQAGQEIRYVEYIHTPTTRVHQISAVGASEALAQVLSAAREGATILQLAATLVEDEADQPEAAAFVEALVEAQLLVSELEPTVTGDEYFQHIRQVLQQLATQHPEPALQAVAQTLAHVHQQLVALDAAPMNSASAYQRIADSLQPLGVPVEAGKLFQTDAVCGLAEATTPTLDVAHQAHLLEALEVLTYLTPSAENPRLADFMRRFQDRYEEQEVPLLEALDNESGLSYSSYGKSRFSELVHDLVLEEPGHHRTPAHNRTQHYMRQRLQAAERHRQYTVEISLAELRSQGFEPETRSLPPSVPLLFRPTGASQLLLESVGGSSAVNLLGRFAHAQPAVQSLIQDITRQEQAHNPDVAFAEICHLPASRTGNLLQRPHFRALEIPYLAQSTLPPDAQVRVQDLTLSVRAGQLVLRCRRRNQVIVPRLSTAHNFAGDMLPVYQFLCDLQTQGVQPSLGFSWQAVAGSATFLPRLSCGAVVLAPATWQFTQADLHDLLAASPAELPHQLAAFRHQWQLPRFFTLADGDNELLIDLENQLLVSVWLSAVRGRASSKLKEFLFDPAASPVRDIAGQPFVPQCIALLVRQTPCYFAAGAPLTAEAPIAVIRSFSLGSEWLYYKLYCGQLVADRVLLEALAPLTAELREQGLIDNWFFVRYSDPDMHLRVRWHLPEPGRIGEVVRLVSEYLAPFIATQSVWKLQTDTYRRELERYGSRSIEATEQLFCYQTDALLARMAQAAEEEAPGELWPWGLSAIEELLTAFNYSLPRKLILTKRLKESFAREFGNTKALKLQLDDKYRSARPLVQQAISSVTNSALPLPAELLAIAARITELEQQGGLEIAKDQLLASYLHMLLNRLLPAEARLHELVLYDFLFRHYQSCLARQQKQEQVPL